MPLSEFSTKLIACATILASLVRPSTSRAQCTPQWLPGDGTLGMNAIVRAATMWDPDGPGPLPARLVVGGNFTRAGNVNSTASIACWDGTQWTTFGSGLVGPYDLGGVYALTTLPNGDLVAGGYLSVSGVPNILNIARWNGSTWLPLGTGLSYSGDGRVVRALATMPNGDLIAAGKISTAGGVSVSNIARWNGSTWSALGSGINGPVYALQVLPNGDLIAGGQFSQAGGTPAANIGRWDGSTWSAVGVGVTSATLSPFVSSMTVLPGGDLLAGGVFDHAGGTTANSIAKWDGSSWTSFGNPFPSGGTYNVWTLSALPNGDVLAGGFGNPFILPGYVSRWNGTTWTVLSSALSGDAGQSEVGGTRAVLGLPDGNIFVGGNFTRVGNLPAPFAILWTPTGWSHLGSGLDDAVSVIGERANGDVIVGGAFTIHGDTQMRGLARFSDGALTQWGLGVGGYVYALLNMPNGDFVIGGYFFSVEGVAMNSIARWNGSSWSPLGTGMYAGTISALALLPNGDIVAGGHFTSAGGLPAVNLAKWNGSAWSSMGTQNSSESVYALAVLPNGDLIVGGEITQVGNIQTRAIARWDGVTWSNIGDGFTGAPYPFATSVRAIQPMPNGDIVVGGIFQSTGTLPVPGIARWNGTNWVTLGSGLSGWVYSLTLNGDDLIVGGSFAAGGSVPSANIVRWNGATWSAIGSGTNGAVVTSLARLDGSILAGGSFTTAGGLMSANFAHFACPPCYPNCDSSTIPPILNVNDFNCFLNKFAAQDPYANCDHSTNPPTLNVNDFQCFLNSFAAGCP